MNLELRLMLTFTRRLPKVKGAGYISNCLRGFYLRKRRDWEKVDVLEFKMTLDPAQNVDGGLLFHPQLVDPHEVGFISERLKPGDTFCDIGANIGYYAMVAGHAVGPSGKVLAIEADPYNCERIRDNLSLNRMEHVRVICAGVADAQQVLRLGIKRQHRGGDSFLIAGDYTMDVSCFPLLDIIRANNMTRIDGAKLDIEGFEFRVLSRFLADAERSVYPKFIVVERNPRWLATEGDVIELLKNNGYQVHSSSRLNYILLHLE